MSTYVIYFSPTSGTEKIVKTIAEEFGPYQEIDLSKREKPTTHVFQKEDVCIIGVPSYGGRVPAIAKERMQDFQGNESKVIFVVAYGNRAYEDTLLELQDFLTPKGFWGIAAISAIAEHSIMHEFASGRPDESDRIQLRAFAKEILKQINRTSNKILALPGNHPYREYHGLPLKPGTNHQCNAYGLCATLCPVGAISIHTPKSLDKDLCISCMRCVSICPMRAKTLNPVLLKASYMKLKKSCSTRKENELIL